MSNAPHWRGAGEPRGSLVARIARTAVIVTSAAIISSATSEVSTAEPAFESRSVVAPTARSVRPASHFDLAGAAPAAPSIPSVPVPPPGFTSATTTPDGSDADCARFPAGCGETNLRPQPVIASRLEPANTFCRLAGDHNPEGQTEVADTSTRADTATAALRVRVEVEIGLAIDVACFAQAVTSILNDRRGWAAGEDFAFQPVSDESYDFRLILASPETTNSLCYPAATGGKYSCRNRDKVVLNLLRWETGPADFDVDLPTYRRYLVNHEVGHLLGHGHRECPGPGEPAPVMMQQTKGLGSCKLNGWPLAAER